jgi:hypothetical protein
MLRILSTIAFLLNVLPASGLGQTTKLDCDLLIVGGNESAVACAVQAARLGVKRIVLVNDIEWLGGQFSAEGVGCMDEWTVYRGKRVNFPRSGLFLEMVQRIHEHNGRTYGVTRPGNAYCGTETIEPAAAAKIMDELMAPYAANGTGQVKVLRGWWPAKVTVEGNRVTGASFVRTDDVPGTLEVSATLTVDSSDWGDVIRLSGARYAAGADAKSRFNEPSAPENPTPEERNEMNPISWCVVLRETEREAIVPAPADYDARKYTALEKTRLFVDSDMSEGVYANSGWSVYTHRRLVDRHHLGFPKGTEATFLNWPVQDYPLYHLPKSVAEALEKTEAGAAKKNVVDMTPAQRRIVFEDAKRHALGLLHWLQTEGASRFTGAPRGFQFMELTSEFGTPDRLPPKPYVREGLRLEALSMLKEQDIRASDRNPKWARVMPPDAVFGFQFNIDFHPTRRQFLNGGNEGPWVFIQTKTRNWHTDTDRAMLSLRSLVPVECDGLLGTSKNIGVSSIVQSALRLHGQMMLCGQASGTVAAICLRDGRQPREVATEWNEMREVQRWLTFGVQGHPGVLLWPYQDLRPDDLCFGAVNMLAMLGIWQGDADSLDFRPLESVNRGELARILTRACKLVQRNREWQREPLRKFTDVPPDHADQVFIQTFCAWSGLGKDGDPFRPDQPAVMSTLAQWLEGLGLHAKGRLSANDASPLLRGDLARILWSALRSSEERNGSPLKYLSSGNDCDGDGMLDLDDAMPFDADNDRIPDIVDVRLEK